ncbi:MAG: hypothetical protein Q8Q73_17340 [Stagnimonas sp.]|nr:hypothetical protein [Stagnimonas sp.]
MPSTRLLWALLPCLLAAPVAAAERYSREQLERQLSGAESQQARQALARLEPAQLLPLIQQTLARIDRDPVPAEALLHRTLLRLREPGAPHDASGEKLLRSLLGYQPQVLVPPADPDHGRGLWVPAYDLAATARGTLAIWQRQDQEQAARGALLSRDAAALRSMQGAVLATVFGAASRGQLQALASSGPWPSAALAVLATRLGDEGLATTLLAQASDAELLDAIKPLASALTAAEAQGWLQQLVEQRPALASAALLAMGRLLPQQSQDYLLAQLDHPDRGSSSAQALAGAATPAVRAALADILDTAPDGPRLRRALLALHWMDDAAARSSLQAFVVAQARPAQLRSEVAAWLR